MPSVPHIINGVLRTRNGTAIANATLVFTNQSTGDTITTTTNSSGQYAIDCNNFEDGYTNKDLVIGTLSLDYDEDDFDLYVSIDSGNTWSIVENESSITMRYNQGRTKIDTTKGGRTVTVRI